MITIDEMEVMLNDIAEELPEAFFEALNGGIMLLPQAKLHPNSVGNELYIMGEYHRDRNLGRYIVIYYGSFSRVQGHLSAEELKEQLRGTLRHEFRHHLESMAGDRGLEKEDQRDLSDYLNHKRERVRRADNQ
jgi:hypothetical protein